MRNREKCPTNFPIKADCSLHPVNRFYRKRWNLNWWWIMGDFEFFLLLNIVRLRRVKFNRRWCEIGERGRRNGKRAQCRVDPHFSRLLMLTHFMSPILDNQTRRRTWIIHRHEHFYDLIRFSSSWKLFLDFRRCYLTRHTMIENIIFNGTKNCFAVSRSAADCETRGAKNGFRDLWRGNAFSAANFTRF